MSRRGSHKDEKFPHTQKLPHGQGLGWGSFGTSEGNAETSARKTKWREFTTEMVTNQHFPDDTVFTPASASRGCIPRLRFWEV